jgi:hypothetical protein
VSEYQVLRECLWTLRNPVVTSLPLFRFDDVRQSFVANRSEADSS